MGNIGTSLIVVRNLKDDPVKNKKLDQNTDYKPRLIDNTEYLICKIQKEIDKLLEWWNDDVLLDPSIENLDKNDMIRELDKIVISQNNVKNIVVEKILDNINPLRKRKGPLWVFVFAWPTSVWKTELARWLASLFLWEKDALTRIPCEDYHEKHTSRNLFSSPKSYLWYWEPTPLVDTELFKSFHTAKKNNKLHPILSKLPNFSILLLDEIEKAHPSIHQNFLWPLDNGKIVLSTWKKTNNKAAFSNVTDLRNTIVIMTSNIWNKETDSNWIWFVKWKANKKEIISKYKKEYKKTFTSEFRARVHNFMIFDQLEDKDYLKILNREIIEINEGFASNEFSNIQLKVEKKLLNYIINLFNREKWGIMHILCC